MTREQWWNNETLRLEFHEALKLTGVQAALETLRDAGISRASQVVGQLIPGASLAEISLQVQAFSAGYFSCLDELLKLDGERPKSPKPPRQPWEYAKNQPKEE